MVNAAIVILLALLLAVFGKSPYRSAIPARFLSALDAGRVELSGEPIWTVRLAERELSCCGVGDGIPFVFQAKTDAKKRLWIFTLMWSGETLTETWEVRKLDPKGPLARAFFVLRSRKARSKQV